jgi:hypothetical protein
MKRVISILIAVAAIALFSFKTPADKSAAKVDQQQGIYVFMLSKPTAEYEYLGSVSKSLAWTGKPEEMLNSMLKKVKKDYPKADGLIFTSIEMDKADAVKFKE